MNINVHIERLILDGLPVTRSQAPFIQTAIEGELMRMLSASGLSPDLVGGVALPSVKAGEIWLTNKNDPMRLGGQVAGGVFSGIGNKRGSLGK